MALRRFPFERNFWAFRINFREASLSRKKSRNDFSHTNSILASLSLDDWEEID